ncbi:MAG: hypothetical protein QM795_13960 [Pseudoxanthomonas sp.]
MDLRYQQLKKYLRDVRGDDQVDLFRFSLTSLRDRIEYAEFHLNEAKRLMLPYTAADGPKPGEDHQPFNRAMTQTGAHVLACLQSLHSCADICAHVVYFGLGANLDPRPIKENLVGARTVLARIANGRVSDALRSLVEDPEFEYLDAVVNRSKHRTVIYTGYLFEARDSADASSWHGVVLWRFERMGRAYPIRHAEAFLESELNRQRVALSKVSNALEDHLLAEWKEQKRIYEARGERWPPARIPDMGRRV